MGKPEIKPPEVPDRYFFRVSRRGVWDGFVRVELRKKAPEAVQDWLWGLGFKKELSFRIRSAWAFSDRPDHISGAMKDLWNKYKDPDATYVGDYL